MEYWETFLKEMKSFLFYFIEFQNDNTILFKKYPENYIVGGLNQQPIIMITNDENTFSTNNSCQKVWILKRHRTL